LTFFDSNRLFVDYFKSNVQLLIRYFSPKNLLFPQPFLIIVNSKLDLLFIFVDTKIKLNLTFWVPKICSNNSQGICDLPRCKTDFWLLYQQTIWTDNFNSCRFMVYAATYTNANFVSNATLLRKN